MGVEWLVCDVCGETFPDAMEHYTCSSCESLICRSCYPKQLIEYGHVKDTKLADFYGEDALEYCDVCMVINDTDVMEYLLDQTGLTRQEVVELIEKRNEIS